MPSRNHPACDMEDGLEKYTVDFDFVIYHENWAKINCGIQIQRLVKAEDIAFAFVQHMLHEPKGSRLFLSILASAF